VRRAGGTLAAEGYRKVLYCGVEIDVGKIAFEEFNEVLAESGV